MVSAVPVQIEILFGKFKMLLEGTWKLWKVPQERDGRPWNPMKRYKGCRKLWKVCRRKLLVMIVTRQRVLEGILPILTKNREEE